MPEDLKGSRTGLYIRKTAAETKGELLDMEAIYLPNSPRPPSHYHPFQEERFAVMEGRFRVGVDAKETTYEIGDSFTVPVGRPHWMHNVAGSRGRLHWQIRPAMQTQQFLETMWGLRADGKTNAQGVPNLLQLAVLLRTYSDEFRASSPPYAVQRLLFAGLATVGHLMGYRPYYRRYSTA